MSKWWYKPNSRRIIRNIISLECKVAGNITENNHLTGWCECSKSAFKKRWTLMCFMIRFLEVIPSKNTDTAHGCRTEHGCYFQRGEIPKHVRFHENEQALHLGYV